MILEHLLKPEYTSIEAAEPIQLLSAQATSADILQQLGAPMNILREDQKQNAREAFSAVINQATPKNQVNAAILRLRVPPAVKHLAVMLSEYDWDFVEQAKQMRGYIVAQLLEESRNPDPKIRLRALQLLGTVTEVGAYTTRVEVTNTNMPANEVTEKLRSKLATLLPKVVEIQDADIKPEELQ